MTELELDLRRIPHSVRGSYVTVLQDPDTEHLVVRNAHGSAQADYFSLSFSFDGSPVAPRLLGSPAAVRVLAAERSARVYLAGDHGLVVDSQGLDVHLVAFLAPYGSAYQQSPTRFVVHTSSERLITTVDVVHGDGVLDTEWGDQPGGFVHCSRAALHVRAAGGTARLTVEMRESDSRFPEPVATPDADITALHGDWAAFRRLLPPVPSASRAHAELAWYVLWSSVVRAGRAFPYDAVLMNKHVFGEVWSWDHCFNALALARADPRAGVEQLMLPFELQLPNGRLPERFGPAGRHYNFTKPPIQGWCLSRLLACHEVDGPSLRRLRDPMAAWTTWWLSERDFDGDGIPCYPTAGDSGWDNATPFDHGGPLESPDLAAYLVLQMHALAELEDRLGDLRAAAAWRSRAEDLLDRALAHLWTSSGFVLKANGTHDYDPAPTSLLALMPLVLGEHLDSKHFDVLADRLELDFLTPGGPATEALTSRKFAPDAGYGTRGTIWPSATYLLVDGLARGGRRELAARIARGFCAMVERSGAFYEWYDPLTGAGGKGSTHTWTASVYLLLLTEYLQRPEPLRTS